MTRSRNFSARVGRLEQSAGRCATCGMPLLTGQGERMLRELLAMGDEQLEEIANTPIRSMSDDQLLARQQQIDAEVQRRRSKAMTTVPDAGRRA